MEDFKQIEEAKAKALISEQIALQKAFQSQDVEQIFKAQQYIQKNSSIQKKEDIEVKSILIDPLELTSSFGYKDKTFNISYDILRGMSRTHVIKSIIETRKEQVSSFCEPQIDKGKPGFVIRKKQTYFDKVEGKEAKLSSEDKANIIKLIDFVLNCGDDGNQWLGDDFDDFARKVIQDSLTLDQATFEVIRDRRGAPVKYFATDGATYRLADSFLNEKEDAREMIAGYAPAYVQIYQSRILNEFYPWELCFGIRNPSTDIRTNGYGRSELEDMIQTVTAILNSDHYNANFFKVGSAPKGILKYSGNINPNTVDEFKKQWTAQVAGVANMHKIPMINADKMEFINTHIPNKDMEYAKYQDFLIKISCAMYKIDPSEIGFPMDGSTGSSPMFQSGNVTDRVEYSRDKGLQPLLRKLQKWIQRFLIDPKDDRYEFIFVGLDEDEEDKFIERHIKEVSNYKTLNEIRAEKGLKPVEGGDIVLNPTFLQGKSMDQMGGDESNQFIDEEMGGDEEMMDDDNPFTKAIMNELNIILS